MPIRKALKDGAFRPSEVELLIRVFEAGSVANEAEDQKEHRASRIIAAYMTGISDEKELLEVSRRPLGRAIDSLDRSRQGLLVSGYGMGSAV